MAVILYKKGNTHKVRGVKCEACVCDENSFQHMLDSGEWFLSPQETLGEEVKQETVVEETVEEITEEVEVEETEEKEWPEKIGGAWYLLSDGNKVNGKAKAVAAQAELDK